MYAVSAREEALDQDALFGTPGIVTYGAGVGTLATNKGRGAETMGGVYYTVQGTLLYSVDSAGVATSRGTIEGTGRVSMAHNGLVLCIVVPGGKAYTYTAATTTLAEITDVDYTTSDTVTFSDGYYIFTETDGTNWFVSALNDPSTIDALDFGSAELNPDDIVAGFANYDEVVIFGTETTERFSNIGGAGFPYQRIPGASYEKGCHARHTPIEWEGQFYFAGGGRNEKTSIYAGGGTAEPQRISTDAIDTEIQKFSTAEIEAAFSFSYSIRGYSFIGFTFRSLVTTDRTFVYNVTYSQLSGKPTWLEQQTGVDESGWRVNSVTFVYDKLIVSDNVDGRLGYLDVDTYSEYSSDIIREKITGPIYGENALYFSSVELTVDTGQGLITGQGSDPMIMMDYSDTGARTWSSEFWRSLGKIGEYRRIVEWRRLGRSRKSRTFRFRMSDPIKPVWIKLEVNLNAGS
jgi:hypothetical protein